MLQMSYTLEQIAETNISQFYSGSLARIMVSEINEAGGNVTLDDFKSYQAVVTEPVVVNLDETSTLYTNPVPSSGILVSFIMRIMKGIYDDGGTYLNKKGYIIFMSSIFCCVWLN